MNRTTTVIVALIAAASLSTIVIGPQQQALAWHHHPAAHAAAAPAVATGGAVPPGSWLTAPYGDSPDALFFCGAGLRQFTGIGAYGCGNGPEGGQVVPWSVAFGPQFPIGIPHHWAFNSWGCGGFGFGCGGFGGGCGGFGGGCGGFGGGCGGIGIGCGGGFFGGPFGLHRHVLQDTTQANNCQRGQGNNDPQAAAAAVSPTANTNSTNANAAASGGSEDASDNSNPGGNHANAQTSCLNTGVNTAGRTFGGLLGQNGLDQNGEGQ